MHFDGGFETMEILSKPESGKDRVSVPMSENMKTNFKTNGSKTAQLNQFRPNGQRFKGIHASRPNGSRFG